MTLDAVGVVIPAHDEEALLGSCLASVARAVDAVVRRGKAARVVVVLDACGDRSREVAEAWRPRFAPGAELIIVETDDANVGAARQAGFDRVLVELAGFAPTRTWLATTDADSTVPGHWLAHQVRAHSAGVRAWAGTVEFDPRNALPIGLRSAFEAHYDTAEGAEHTHVHGANLGLDAHAYRLAGGFLPLPTAEDHALYRAVRALGIAFCHDLGAPVQTSARCDGRAPDGFAADVLRLLTRAAEVDPGRSAPRAAAPAPRAGVHLLAPG